jgi:hypothetical protein
MLFLSNIPINNTNKSTDNKIRKVINLSKTNTKLDENIKEIINYKKEDLLKDALDYLTNITKITDNTRTNNRANSSKKNNLLNEYIVEIEELDGLKLIKLDSEKRVKYYIYLYFIK